MKTLELNRFYGNDTTTLGCLTCAELDYPLFTCELAWNNNQTCISCIPRGVYKIKPYTSPHFGKCLIIENVPGRKYILVHPGNIYEDTEGCILPGLYAGNLKGLPAVLKSREAFNILLDLVTDTWNLVID